MSLKARIRDDMKAAMRSGDKARLGTIRMLLADIQRREVDERTELDDSEVLAVLEKMVKQRRESINQYREAGREELAETEQAEITVLQEYLPEPLSEAELDTLIEEVIQATGAAGMQDMGKVMGQIKQKAQGRADMGAVSARVKARLSA